MPHLQSRFTNLKEIVEIDLKNVPNEADWPDLLRYLQKHFLALDHIGVPHPKTWVEVRKTLDADPRDTLSREAYLALCAQQGITDPADALQLSDYLHHLGDILHFQDDPILTDLVILKPTWGLDAVYRVLDNMEIAAANGQFTLTQLRDLWYESRYNHRRNELLRLMQKFQLCYLLRDGDDIYIAPQLLDTKTPNYAWGGDKDDLQLRYSYTHFMPRGILSRVIVALHHRIEDQRLVWRTGVVLCDEFARAELLELRGEGEIHIRVSGRLKRNLLMEIVYALDDLHQAFPKLSYDKLVPCNCMSCTAAPMPHFFRLGKLLERLQNQKETIECENPPYTNVPIRNLVDDVILQTEFHDKDGNKAYFIIGDYVKGDKNKMTSNTSGDTFNISGDFRGSNVNIKSRLTNVRQTIGTLPHADDDTKAELQQLISQLNDALQAAPADKKEDAEAVAQMAETLVETAASEKPNKMMLQITGDGLKQAAENIAAVMPAVLGIALKIVTAVYRLTG